MPRLLVSLLLLVASHSGDVTSENKPSCRKLPSRWVVLNDGDGTLVSIYWEYIPCTEDDAREAGRSVSMGMRHRMMRPKNMKCIAIHLNRDCYC